MGKKILIIDDSEDDREVLSTYLQEAGFSDLAFANTGERGIEAVKEIKPDIVILDTNLPGMNGFETCKKIKEIKEVDVNVIMMTGAVDAVDAVKARKHGADDYCAKSSDCDDLIEAVKELL